MDFHLTEELDHVERQMLSDKLLSLLPSSTAHESIGSSDRKETVSSTADGKDCTDGIENRGQLHNDIIQRKVSQDEEDNGLGKDSVSDSVTLIADSKDFIPDHNNVPAMENGDKRSESQQRNQDSFKSSKSSGRGSDDVQNDENAASITQDLSWNDSDLSDEEHIKSLEGDKKVADATIEKSSISTSFVSKKRHAEKADGTTQETSFSSTLERVTPSSSIVSSILDEISPVESSDEETDFDFSTSLIPDLSSFTLEDKDAFEKCFGRKEETNGASNDVETKQTVEPLKDEAENILEIDKGKDLTNVDSENVVEDNKGPKQDMEILRTSISMSSNSWKEDDYNDDDDSFNQGLQSLEADSADVLMALEEFETRKKEEFNDTLKDQIVKESHDKERSFTERNDSKKGDESATTMQGNVPGAKLHAESKIPKLNTSKLASPGSQPRKSPGKSNIPIFSPPRTPSKSKQDIELVERNRTADLDQRPHVETMFMDAELMGVHSNEDTVDAGGLEIKADLKTESDVSSESEDELGLSLTRDTLSFGQEELDARISYFQAILNSDSIDKDFQVCPSVVCCKPKPKRIKSFLGL